MNRCGLNEHTIGIPGEHQFRSVCRNQGKDVFPVGCLWNQAKHFRREPQNPLAWICVEAHEGRMSPPPGFIIATEYHLHNATLLPVPAEYRILIPEYDALRWKTYDMDFSRVLEGEVERLEVKFIYPPTTLP